MQTEEAEDEHHDDDEADKVDDAVHAYTPAADNAGSERKLISRTDVPCASARRTQTYRHFGAGREGSVAH
jgi:hypothetical protein